MYITYDNLRWKSELLERNINPQNIIFQLKGGSCDREMKCLGSGCQETFHPEPRLRDLSHCKHLLAASAWRGLVFENISKIRGQRELEENGKYCGSHLFILQQSCIKNGSHLNVTDRKMHLRARVCFVTGGTGGDLTDGKKYLAIVYKLHTIVSTVSSGVKI